MYIYAKDMEIKKQTLQAQRNKLISRISKLNPWIEGSVVTTTRICGKKNCACHREGPKHPVMYVTWKESGKTISLYVPKGLEAEVSKWALNYKKLKEMIREISNIQKDIVRLREKR
jgi:hypothetical protein